MNRFIFTILIFLLSNKIYSQVSYISIEIPLYSEPQSIIALKNNWRDDNEGKMELGSALLIAGFTTTALCIYEGNETWKYASRGVWKYDPFISQSTRPFMMTAGIGASLTGLYFLLK